MGANDMQEALNECKGLFTQHMADTMGSEASGSYDAGGDGTLDAGALAIAQSPGAPPGLVVPDEAMTRAVAHLHSRGALTRENIVGLARHLAEFEKHHGHRHGHAHGVRLGFHHARHMPGALHPVHVRDHIFWHRSPAMETWRYDIIKRYIKIHGDQVDEGIGFYYGTLQVPLGVESSGGSTAFTLAVPPASGNTLNPVIDTCFDFGIGDIEPNWFGGPHTLNQSDTNLQNPGRNLYADELFIIEAVSMRLKAVRIQYYLPGAGPGPFPGPLGPVTTQVLQGTAPVWDRGALVLPQEMFNQYSDVCELAQAVAMCTTINFGWSDLGLGGNDTIATKLIERMNAVPGVGRFGVQETSGAGLTLDLPRGFIWCLDNNPASVDEGGNGLFSAQLRQQESFSFPFTPVPLYGVLSPVLPIGVCLEWQIMLHGSSILPRKGMRHVEFLPRRRT